MSDMADVLGLCLKAQLLALSALLAALGALIRGRRNGNGPPR